MRLLLFLISLIISNTVFAVCPVCTFAVGAGIGLTKYFGVDDTITGVWIGGFIVSLIVLTKNWLKKRNINFYGSIYLIIGFYFATTVVPLTLSGIIGHSLNKLWGIDKIILGIIVGSMFFFLAAKCYEVLKKHHGDRAYFPFQKVLMPLLPLILFSVIFYFITK